MKFDISENARNVLERRYLKKDKDGNPIEAPEDMLRRVSKNIAEAEKNYNKNADLTAIAEEFYEMMASLEFLPNSPTLMNAGRGLQQLAACFVLPIEDSMESIFETVKNTALIHKSGGGTGFSFSKLRPSGDMVGSTSGISSGPISFMTVFDSATEAIKQGGTRRGANMGILRIDHPDIESFITCKEDNSKLNNFNISVNITDEFMQAVDNDTDFDLKNPRSGEPVGKLNARAVYDKIVNMAWKNGDPGIIFIDRINKDNPTPHIGEMESTNPCGEQPLLPYESCNLGSINLSRMLKKASNGSGSDTFEVDYDRLGTTIDKAVRFLDNVIDMNRYPIEEIDKTTKSNRKIGLGVMGFSDMLMELAIPYNSEEAITVADEVMGFVQKRGHEASENLAKERGSFPNFKGSIFDGKHEMRNATITTIAPTGTISIINSCSSGIEPLFALAFTRNVMEGTELLEVNPIFEKVAERMGILTPELLKEAAKTGSIHEVEGIPESAKRIFVTSHEIDPEWHIRMQAVFQKYTDNAVSKTVNFNNDATVEDVEKVYRLAYDLGCKGVTVYRDGSRDAQVLTRGDKSEAPKVETEATTTSPPHGFVTEAHLRPRGEVAFGITKKMKTGCGNLYVTVNEDASGMPVEIFTQIGKAGGCATSQCEAIGRMASLAMRGGIAPEEIVKQMRGISCHLPVGYGADKVSSCSDAMAQAMDWYMSFKRHGQSVQLGGDALGEDSGKLAFTLAPELLNRGACPDCGGTVEHADGCVVCRGCGYTECG
ncbi:MAG: vitamin B12-dependent ribonucleotide reductase [Deltaproteobacteria bacterium]|nr:vitamin B12-dependent ribonucleotide reductase [Deltaproteobacteria bacterium]